MVPLSVYQRCRQALFVALTLLLWLPLSAYAMDYTIKGVDDNKLRENIRLHLNNLNLDNDLLIDPFWQDEIAKTVATAVEPFGYYNSTTDVTVDKDNKTLVTVTLNSPLTVANVTREIIGEGREDPDFRAQFNAFALKPGDTLLQPTYESFKSAMFNYALSHGYFDFSWQATRLDLVREERQANILLIAQSGKRYQFGNIVIVGEDKAKAIIERLRPFEAGDDYSSAKLTEFNSRLNQSGYFNRVIARPVVSEAEGRKVPIEITLTHKPKDIYNAGIGAATDTGPRVRLKWTRPWVNSHGHSVSSELFLSRPEQSITMDYRIPMKDINNDFISLQAGYQFIDYSNTDTKSETLSFSAHRYWKDVDSPWMQDGSLTYLRELYEQGSDEPQTTTLIMPGYALHYLQKDDPLNINSGTYFQAFIQGGRDNLGSDINIVKSVVEGKMIRTFGEHRFTVRGEVGAIKTNDFNKVPASLRFFAGGDDSVRGFSYRDISPFDSVFDPETGELNNQPIGGKYLATASVEYAYRVADNWRIALFTDTGLAANDFNSDPAYSVGTGFHWISPIGPVRVYFARGYYEGDSSWHLHFILGPEL